MNENDPNDPETRVSTRMAFLMIEMLRSRGVDPQVATRLLRGFTSPSSPPPYIAWADYVKLMHLLEETYGSGDEVRRGVKALTKSAYSEIRALAGFFPGLMPFFVFVNTQLMREMTPAGMITVEVLDARRARATFRYVDGVTPCQIYWDGTLALIEMFPWHADLVEEAKVEVLARTDRELVVAVEFPADVREEDRWGVLRHRIAAPTTAEALTAREEEVLDLVVKGLTNAEIAAALGTAAGTVKNQISSILAKMDAANRTELAARSRDR